jgi:methionine-rich copper-binding protein CopC
LKIELRFNEDLALKLSKFKLTEVCGDLVAVTKVDGENSKILAATPTKPSAGLYKVSWTAVSEDGHKKSTERTRSP